MALHGSKLYITNAPFADFLLVAARTSAALSRIDQPVHRRTAQRRFDIAKLKKEGIRASETALIHIDNAFVPDDCLLGETEGTYPLILESLKREPGRRGGQCAGHGARGVRRGGQLRQRPPRRRQARGRIPGHRARWPTCRRRSKRRAGWSITAPGAWDQGTLDAATAARVKLVASETAVAVSEQAIRIFGGAGIMREYPVGRIHRDALVYVIGEGTSEIQKNIIARSLGFRAMSDYVLRERRGATFVITLNRPERRNAFDLEVRQSLPRPSSKRATTTASRR